MLRELKTKEFHPLAIYNKKYTPIYCGGLKDVHPGWVIFYVYVQCAWSEDDWRKDMERKLSRHTIRNGSEHESLAESSHDAWIHLYRSHSFSREIQISYYLEGELAIFCVDAELRKRSKGKHGICDLMVKLCEKYTWISKCNSNRRRLQRY